jgi:cytochrome c peroxidase
MPASLRSAAAAIALLSAVAGGSIARAEYGGNSGILPAGSELDNEAATTKPRELFHSEAIQGRKSYMVRLADMAFSAPSLLGGAARQAGMSCDTCHVNGAGNPRLFVPGMSTVPGTFDTTGPLFNPKADNGIQDPVTVPSLRGARFLAPYGHDGRMGSLRDFVRNVVVNEFSGAEPSPEILDAIVAYIQDIDFLPNPRLDLDGKLKGTASESEKRGQALFSKPFAHDPSLSCAGCHNPSAGFVDHQQHDVGSLGLFKTPTLLNANFNAPYFHDGRYASYDEVVIHFDRMFYLGLSAQDRQDLVAYLKAVGDGQEPSVPDNVTARLKEINDFTSVFDTAIPAHDAAVVALAQDTVGGELRDFAEGFPERKDATVTGGKEERAKARAALKEAVLALHAVGTAAEAGKFDAAGVALENFRAELAQAVPLLRAAEPWSIYNPEVRAARFAAFRTLYKAAVDPLLVARRFDND